MMPSTHTHTVARHIGKMCDEFASCMVVRPGPRTQFIESQRWVEWVLGLSSLWNILRPYAKKGKRACNERKERKKNIENV